MKKQDFDRLVLEAVDEGLSVLGESSKQAVYFHLAKTFHIRKDEIPKKIEEFDEAMKKIFGLGAGFLEILIMQRLYRKVDGSLDWDEAKDLTLVEYVGVVRRCFKEQRAKEKTVGLMRWEDVVKREG
ncbi:MAG: hypothetical protein ACUVT5_02100 [Candidatus Bathyarchaeales archaeon]